MEDRHHGHSRHECCRSRSVAKWYRPSWGGVHKCRWQLRGTRQCILATFEILLSASSPSGGKRFEYVCLHVQGQLVDDAISATAVDLTDSWRRADVRLERRALVARQPTFARTLVTAVPISVEPPQDNAENTRLAVPMVAASEPSRTNTTGENFPAQPTSHEVLREALDRCAPAVPMSTFGTPGHIAGRSMLSSVNPREGKKRK